MKSERLEVFFCFLRLGLTGFGGPLAHIAMFEEEFVRRRAWLPRERFLERLSLTQLIPGPNSTELAMQIGFERAGWPGFILGGLGFLTPAVVMVALLAEFYRNAVGFSFLSRWLWGTLPVVGALIVVMLIRGILSTFRSISILPSVLVGFSLYVFSQNVVASLLGASFIRLLQTKMPFRALLAFFFTSLSFLPLPLTQLPHHSSPTISSLFLEMLYLGSIVMGSGYVLFSYFSSQLVDRLQWVDRHTLAIGIAAGQLTPGPLFASSAFFGQLLQGPIGAIVCTVGIFAPAFFFSAMSIPLARRLENSPWWRESLLAMSALSFVMLARESLSILPTMLDRPMAYVFFLVALLAHARFRVNSALLLTLGALAGAFLG